MPVIALIAVTAVVVVRQRIPHLSRFADPMVRT